jgi:hypothetical protein
MDGHALRSKEEHSADQRPNAQTNAPSSHRITRFRHGARSVPHTSEPDEAGSDLRGLIVIPKGDSINKSVPFSSVASRAFRVGASGGAGSAFTASELDVAR